ncbi:MAG: hypothetical protein K0R39_1691 [Symbiobacteriaceae bacterium]|jgi:hypothetical protein|nr:hypothetical protein [Symbiobacteriaceae bacterium]
MAYRLGERISAGGVAHARFFNGRLLTAEDLRLEQDAARLHRLRLGEAVGAGVVHGLEVQMLGAPEGAVVRIGAGLAISPEGDALRLTAAADVVLTAGERAPRTAGGRFGPLPPAPAEAARPALALLVMEPAAVDENLAYRSGFAGNLTGADLSHTTFGVRVTLIPCGAPMPAGSPGRRQNLAAHLCFGTADRLGAPWLDLPDPQGLARLQPASPLSPAMVPLALVGLAGSQVIFIDCWAVRGAGRPDAIGQQFDAQIAALRSAQPDVGAVRASDHFRYLPPAGCLPAGVGGFRWQTFFQGAAVAPIDLDPAFLRPWLEQARGADPIDLDDPPGLWVWQPEEGDRILFVRREGQRSVTYVETAAVIIDVMVAAPAEVWVADEAGRRYAADRLGQSHAVWGLQPGIYTAWAKAPGGRPAGQHLRLRMGETVRVALQMEEQGGPPATALPRPPVSLTGRWMAGYDLLTINPPSPGAGELPADGVWVPVASVPDSALAWLKEWGAWIRQANPALPVDLENVRVLLRSTEAAPSALAVFGEGGAWLHLIGSVAPPEEPAKPQPGQPGGILEPDPWSQAAVSEDVPPRRPARQSWLRRLGNWLILKDGPPPQG